MKYDIIIVGSGPGGYVAAIRAAQLGKRWRSWSVRNREASASTGAASRPKALLKAHRSTLIANRPNITGSHSRARCIPIWKNRGALARRGRNHVQGRGLPAEENNIDLIQGFGRLTAAGRLDVGGTHYEADHIILATGRARAKWRSCPSTAST